MVLVGLDIVDDSIGQGVRQVAGSIGIDEGCAVLRY